MRRWKTLRRAAPALTLLLAPAASAGELVTDQPLVHDGLTRSFHYYVPDNVPLGPRPLVLVLHGGGGSADQITGLNGTPSPWKLFMDVAEREKFYVVYPDGVDHQWNDCRGDAPGVSDADDVGFLSRVIDWAAATFEIDLDRVYATGVSNGGHMSFRLARELPERLAAIAPVVAQTAAVNECAAPKQPMPLLMINGTEDPLVPWEGGEIAEGGRGTVRSVAETVALWTAVNGCTLAPSSQNLPNPDTSDESTITAFRFTDCAAETEVTLYAVLGGGHALPSSRERYSFLYELIVGKQNHDVEGVVEIWKFLRRFRRSG